MHHAPIGDRAFKTLPMTGVGFCVITLSGYLTTYNDIVTQARVPHFDSQELDYKRDSCCVINDVGGLHN